MGFRSPSWSKNIPGLLQAGPGNAYSTSLAKAAGTIRDQILPSL